MTKKKHKKILLLGSGALKIGEAGEFDYSGSQALKGCREEGFETILINPNIATVQTSEGMADKVYFLPVNADFATEVIAKERPDGILLGFGGQTALNCGLELERRGVLKKYHVEVMGTPIGAIIETEDRALFRDAVKRAGLKTPKSIAVLSVKDALKIAKSLGYPVMIRSAYSLGGTGSGIIRDAKTMALAAEKAFCFAPQILIEECLSGWKEIEYEVVRDRAGNCIVVCNMENIDPMGIHTGESIVVAPSQTLDNREYHMLRTHAITLITSLGIVGECNIQFALDNASDDYRIIEVNARLSRSSALASKTTGYPLAYVAAKLSLGHLLPELRNSVTLVTTACFEPALDYVTVKVPRWDLKKFKNVSKQIGTEMKSVGEVMAIGRTFEEAFQKALRMLNVGAPGFACHTALQFTDLLTELSYPTDERVFAIADAFRRGWTTGRIAGVTKIDRWFLEKMKGIIALEERTKKKRVCSGDELRELKRSGFSDDQISVLLRTTPERIRALRKRKNILPAIKQIDTLAAEYPAKTNYLYATYAAASHDGDIAMTSRRKKIMLIGSGPYKIGSSVEFDWCGVSTLRTLRKAGIETIAINCNPETVSTDYDECDRLYFEELSLERIMDVYDREQPEGIILAMGGQIPNNLACGLAGAGARILGTTPNSIDQAEDRHAFARLLDRLGIAQPEWQELDTVRSVKAFARKVGYPVLVRPSYVISGAAMGVAFGEKDLAHLLGKALAEVNRAHPVVASKFITGAKELEVDAVAQNGTLIIYAVTEHIENAGVHSGDATIVLPAQKLYRETEERLLSITRAIAKELNICGPFNIQFLAKNNAVMVIECNMRASRSFPFISKALGMDFIEIATHAILGKPLRPITPARPDYVVVKAPQFSFAKLRGSDPVLTVEMTSTGEVGCFGRSVEEAYLKSLIATGFRLPQKRVLLSLGGDENKVEFLESVGRLQQLGLDIFTTPRTQEFLKRYHIHTTILYKPNNKKMPSVEDALRKGKIDLFINTSDENFPENIPDDYLMRRMAVDYNIPLITNIQSAKLFVGALYKLSRGEITLTAAPWDSYIAPKHKRGQKNVR